ncbi:ZIP family metal transporter [Halobaculum sp. MBLA0143]|uniref:ZIP family metal transporter n=1 Tax=Halobaculum sp. MBLA0143 TaxID=3079933 RepID=UPI003526B0FE
MVTAAELTFVGVAGLVTALATGIGAVPFFLFDEIGDRWNVALWGLASGIMLAASGFGLVVEGLAASNGFPTLLLAGLGAGVVLVVVADAVLERVEIGDDTGEPSGAPATEADTAERTDGGQPNADVPLASRAVADGDARKLLLILGILTVHSFPEGVAVGVSFADVGLEGGVPILGVTVPLLAVFMTVAISIHNVPEGVAVSIPLRSMGVGETRMVGAAVLSSLPQPIGAVIAFLFVSWARAFLPFGFGFAAGAMVFLVLTEFLPEALEIGADLEGDGYRELVAGLVAGVASMLPLLLY